MRLGAWLPLLAAVALSATLVAAAAQSPNRRPGYVEPSAGRLVPNPRSRSPGVAEIIDGGVALNGEFGFVVAIFFDDRDGGRYICTGTLLTEQLVLTAGHCGCGIPGTYTIDYRGDARDGVQRRYDNVDGAPILYDQRICYDGDLSGGRDLALLRLRDTAKLDAKISGYPPDRVWELRSVLPPGRRLTAVGYGYTESAVYGVRMQGDIPIVSFDCTAPGVSSVCMPFAEMILAEAAGSGRHTDTCGGDSGGPVFLIENNRRKLVAVTSRAAPGLQNVSGRNCGGGGIYTLIGRRTVQDWLRANGVPEAR